jgi:hypothetical protein
MNRYYGPGICLPNSPSQNVGFSTINHPFPFCSCSVPSERKTFSSRFAGRQSQVLVKFFDLSTGKWPFLEQFMDDTLSAGKGMAILTEHRSDTHYIGESILAEMKHMNQGEVPFLSLETTTGPAISDKLHRAENGHHKCRSSEGPDTAMPRLRTATQA